MVLLKKNITVSLGTIINDNVNIICYYSEDVVPLSLRPISRKDFSSLPPLHVPMEEHDNIMDENKQRESIEYEISLLLVTQ